MSRHYCQEPAPARAMPDFDLIWRNARLLTVDPSRTGLGIVERGAVAIREGRLAYVGTDADLPADARAPVMEQLDGRWVTPGLVDCHTHLVHAGDRAQEFEQRLAGASYEEIARAGGGIMSTVRATRTASEADLIAASLPRLDRLIDDGVTTVEIKSGYALETAGEACMLTAARRLGQLRPVTISTSFLGAHALPPEANGDKDAYVDLICREMLPRIAAEKLADAVDGFCENIAFSPAQIERVFAAAQRLSLPVRLHADQLSNLNGAALTARFAGLSADHLEWTDDAGIRAMAAAGTVAVLLPGAYYFLRETKLPPIAELRRHGVPIAVATDCNPGTSPLTSILLAMNMAATCFRLTVDEILAGVTRNAAQALGLLAQTGTLETGKWADLAVWEVERPAELVYRMGFNPLYRRVWRGQ